MKGKFRSHSDFIAIEVSQGFSLLLANWNYIPVLFFIFLQHQSEIVSARNFCCVYVIPTNEDRVYFFLF